MAWWVIKKWPNGKWTLSERRFMGYFVEFSSYRWSECIEYMNAAEHHDAKKMYALRVKQATLCKGF